MYNKLIVLSLLIVFSTSQTYSITSCTCAQLLSEGDCILNISFGYSLDKAKKTCAVLATPVPPTVTYAAYCDTFAETDCSQAQPCADCGSIAACAWVENKCTFFTGCTPFSKTLDSECQAISNRCITDGTHCVEIDACNTYKKQLPCLKNGAGSLCYWDTTNNTCVDANTCDKLPTGFATDKDCRDVISTCSTKTGGGCVDSGNNCSDQTLEIQCVWNKLKTTACYWDGAACKDRICDNAPTSLTTEDSCKTFRTDETCTTKANGGCITRTTCAAAAIQASCIKNSSGSDCYWTGTACIDKTCANAPVTMTTNSACAGFVTGCITKSGGGCVANGACSVANVQAACVKNSSNFDCIWDTTCKEKTCTNAPITNNTHDLCTSYLPTCTVKSGGGCQNRTCTNAPTTLTTNDAFNEFGSFQCQLYHSSCTSLKDGSGCQEYKTTCQGYAAKNNCATSGQGTCYFDGTDCIRFSNCASVTGTGLNDTICATYDPGCNVNVDGIACQEKLASCNLYFTQNSCSTSQASPTANKCVWSGAACITVTTVGTQCTYVTGTGLTATISATYNTGCTMNKAGTACQEKLATCATYATNQAACTNSQAGVCVWNVTACVGVTTAATDCAIVTGTGLTASICASYNAGCIHVKDGTACQEAKLKCKDYTTQNKCSKQTTSSLQCIWIDNSCYTFGDINCGTGLDRAQCQTYSIGCTSVQNGTKCQDLKSTCEQYPGVSQSCTTTATSKCYLSDLTCITISNVSTDCAKITGSPGYITYDICQSYNPGCSANRLRSACVQQQAQCSGYTVLTSCYKSGAGLCIASTNTDTACVASSTAATCEAVYLGTGNYNIANCNEMKAGCINNGTTGCVAKTCGTASGITFNHVNCNSWLNTCTVNTRSNACQTMATKCADQTSTACLNTIEGECEVVGTSCLRKTCYTAATDSTRNDDTKCSTYLQSCTVARLEACQARTACASYKSQLQCKFNTSGGKCFWNPTNLTCVDLNCGNIETSSLYDAHSKCVLVDATLACTVRATNGAAAQGCMARRPCNSYAIEEQCKTSASGSACVWNTNANLPAPVCQDKSCTSAQSSTTTHNDCYAYYNAATIKCTVAATPSNSGGSPTLGGCQQTAACSSYIDKEQCQINANGDPCGWNETQCADKSCATAPATADYDDDTKCRAYINNKCTVSESGQGCVDIPTTCETMTSKQCYYNKAGDPCYWTETACITKSCDNAPDATATADDCNTYLAGCTLDIVKCKTKICEDFAFATDKQSISTCTSNGINCVARGTCFQAISQAGCVMSRTGQQCEWIPAVLNTLNLQFGNISYTIRNCNTAPISLTSESACAGYFTNCTTKNDGGCVTKTICSAVTIDVGCTTASNGTICAWDSELNKCRDKDCQDFSGTTHAACWTQRAGCTAGANGKCARQQNCEQTSVRAACIEGINGPCLWIDQYLNTDGTRGACFRYTSCKSLTWNNDASCKWISNKCTTNGSKCVGITLCSETNTDGGCVTGYDGACIQSVPALNSKDPKVCKLYNSCADAFYITHADCQIVSSNCTTNGTTGCIALGSCSSYTAQAGCHFNDKGAQYQSGTIISTGHCTWDTTSSSCRDSSCADLTGTTHATCSSQLSTCTSDGTICLLKGACTSYTTQTSCTTAVGSDGACSWELASATNNNTATCRLLTCADIQNGTATNVCLVALSTCVSNGTACIPKSNCSSYTSKIACNSVGLDGLCVFAQSTVTGAAAGTGTCTLMTGCAVANNDQTACQSAKDRCSWTAASGSGANAVASKCVTHTCASNYATNEACTRFLNWDKKTQQICTLLSGTCTSTDPSTLSSKDCFLISGYAYTWNASSNKCGVCTAVVVQPNTTVNNSNNADNNNATTSSGYLLGLSVLLGYLMLCLE